MMIKEEKLEKKEELSTMLFLTVLKLPNLFLKKV